MHGRNGVAHLVARDDVHAAELPRERWRTCPRVGGAGAAAVPAGRPAPGDPGDVLPAREREVYDVREVACALIDGGELLELGPRWARNLVVGFARIEGAPVGIIANQPKHLGGCLDAESSQKGAWFVDLCDRFGAAARRARRHPRLPARRRAGAGRRHPPRRVAAAGVRRATAPRVTVTLRQAYGGRTSS